MVPSKSDGTDYQHAARTARAFVTCAFALVRGRANLPTGSGGRPVMKRRKFITLLGGAAAWPLVARAQQPERIRRIGVLWSYAETDPIGQSNLAALREGLQKLGWSEGRNL